MYNWKSFRNAQIEAKGNKLGTAYVVLFKSSIQPEKDENRFESPQKRILAPLTSFF